VATDDDGPGLADDIRAPGHDAPEDIEPQVAGKGHQIEPGDGLRPHREAVAQGVRRRDAPEVVGVVNDGREKIHRLDKGQIFAELVNARIVARIGAVEQVRIVEGLETAQRFPQVLRTQFGASAARLDQAGEQDFFIGCRRHFFSPLQLFFPRRRKP
jgi:hypothetical protein